MTGNTLLENLEPTPSHSMTKDTIESIQANTKLAEDRLRAAVLSAPPAPPPRTVDVPTSPWGAALVQRFHRYIPSTVPPSETLLRGTIGHDFLLHAYEVTKSSQYPHAVSLEREVIPNEVSTGNEEKDETIELENFSAVIALGFPREPYANIFSTHALAINVPDSGLIDIEATSYTRTLYLNLALKSMAHSDDPKAYVKASIYLAIAIKISDACDDDLADYDRAVCYKTLGDLYAQASHYKLSEIKSIRKTPYYKGLDVSSSDAYAATYYRLFLDCSVKLPDEQRARTYPIKLDGGQSLIGAEGHAELNTDGFQTFLSKNEHQALITESLRQQRILAHNNLTPASFAQGLTSNSPTLRTTCNTLLNSPTNTDDADTAIKKNFAAYFDLFSRRLVEQPNSYETQWIRSLVNTLLAAKTYLNLPAPIVENTGSINATTVVAALNLVANAEAIEALQAIPTFTAVRACIAPALAERCPILKPIITQADADSAPPSPSNKDIPSTETAVGPLVVENTTRKKKKKKQKKKETAANTTRAARPKSTDSAAHGVLSPEEEEPNAAAPSTGEPEHSAHEGKTTHTTTTSEATSPSRLASVVNTLPAPPHPREQSIIDARNDALNTSVVSYGTMIGNYTGLEVGTVSPMPPRPPPRTVFNRLPFSVGDTAKLEHRSDIKAAQALLDNDDDSLEGSQAGDLPPTPDFRARLVDHIIPYTVYRKSYETLLKRLDTSGTVIETPLRDPEAFAVALLEDYINPLAKHGNFFKFNWAGRFKSALEGVARIVCLHWRTNIKEANDLLMHHKAYQALSVERATTPGTSIREATDDDNPNTVVAPVTTKWYDILDELKSSADKTEQTVESTQAKSNKRHALPIQPKSPKLDPAFWRRATLIAQVEKDNPDCALPNKPWVHPRAPRLVRTS